MVRITVNGREHRVADGRTILDALRAAGIDAPHLCHDDRLAPAAVRRPRARYGSAVLPVRVDPSLRPGRMFATFHTANASLNDVTGPRCDAVTRTPEYNLTAVRVRSVRTPDERPRQLAR